MRKYVKQNLNDSEFAMWFQKVIKNNGKTFKWTDRQGYTFVAAAGTPSKVDILFLYFFMLKTQQNNWDRELILTRYEVLKSCDITPSKAQYDRLIESLKKWKGVTISFAGTFYNGEKYIDMEFGIIETWELRKNDKKLRIELNNNWLLKTKESPFYRYVNFEEIKKLKSPLSLRLFEILDKNFYGRNIWEIGILKLGAKIPMAEKHIAHIIPKVQAAVRKIKDKTSLDVSVETVKQGRGKGKFIFTKVKTKQTALPKQIAPPEQKALPKAKAKAKQKNLTTIQQNLQRQKQQMQEQNKIQRKKQALEKKINKLSKKNLQKLDNYIAVQDLNSMQQRFFDLKKMDSLRLHYYSECFSVKAVNEITYDL